MPRQAVTAFTRRVRQKAREIAARRQAANRASNIAAARNRRLRASNVRIGGFLGIENKFYDTSLTAALTASTNWAGAEHDPAGVLCISAPAQGDGESNRDGKKINITSAHVTGTIYCAAQANQTASDAAPVVFIALVLDMQTNGAQLNSEDVYTNPLGNSIANVNPLRNLQYSKRFKVLKTKTLQLPVPSITYDGTNIEQSGFVRSFRMDISKMALPVTFTATTAGVANVVDNSLHIIAVATNIDMAPAISYNARIRFVG